MANKRLSSLHLRVNEDEKRRIERYQQWLAKEGMPGISVSLSDAARSLLLAALQKHESTQKGRVT